MTVIYEYIEKISRFFVPYLIMFALFVFNIVFVSSSEDASVNIPLTMMVVYYWSIYRPMLIPPVLVFIAGISLDALSLWPIGISAMIFLLIRQSVSRQRLFLTGQPFIVIWLGFIGALLVSSVIQWVIFSLIYWQVVAVDAQIMTIIASILMFPIISLALHLSHKILPKLHDQYTAVG